jgi:hypothetical protein
MENSVSHILGILSSKTYDLETKKEDYMIKIVVSEDVYNWLNMHDLEVNPERQKIFICNQVKYVDLGIVLNSEKL